MSPAFTPSIEGSVARTVSSSGVLLLSHRVRPNILPRMKVSRQPRISLRWGATMPGPIGSKRKVAMRPALPAWPTPVTLAVKRRSAGSTASWPATACCASSRAAAMAEARAPARIHVVSNIAVPCLH